MIIKYYRKQVYGTELYYAADPAQAKAITHLTGQKTLTYPVRHGLTMLNYRFKEVLAPKEAV